MPITLSPTTRADSFSDYIALSAYQAYTLESRAKIARGKGAGEKIDTWFVPMPQQLTRITTHNYEAVETSFAYSLQKLSTRAGDRLGGLPLVGNTIQDLIGSAKNGLSDSSNDVAGRFKQLGGTAIANSATKLALGALSTVDMLNSSASMATDQPAIAMSNQELQYAGSIERQFTLYYDFVAKSHLDIYGPNGVLTLLAQLEAYSFPKSFSDILSNRDLIATPPIWRMDHAIVDSTGGVSVPNQSAPLAYLGQPKLLVLYNVTARHDTTAVAVDGSGNTYPLRTQLALSFREIEPVVRFESDEGSLELATYGEITAPKLLSRSEVYADPEPNFNY